VALASLERRIKKAKKPLDRGAIERQIGRLSGRNSRAAGAFSISITEDASHPSGLRLTRSYRPEWADWAQLTEGVYILRTNISTWTDEALWQTYIQLTEAEAVVSDRAATQRVAIGSRLRDDFHTQQRREAGSIFNHNGYAQFGRKMRCQLTNFNILSAPCRVGRDDANRPYWKELRRDLID
jgi:hypothetical protein